MDLATIVILSSAIIIILQIIAIALIVKGKKPAALPEPVAVPAPAAGDNRDFRKRRDENQFNRRPAQDSRPRQPSTPEPQPVDHVEKSLRDINLRLKNAERDQENARKKIKDVVASPQNPQRRPDQNNNRPRGRDDDFRRRDNNRDRNNNRPQGGQFRDRNRNPETDRPQMDQPVQSPLPPLSAGATVAPLSQTASPVEILPRPQNAIAIPVSSEKEQIVAIPENTEVLHGRKVLVRRRILTGEEEAAAGAKAVTPENQPVIGAVVLPTPEKSSTPLLDESVGDVPPIRFGR